MPPWSYSSLTKYETCPRQYHQVRVLKKFKDEQGEAARWGTRAHEAFEKRIRDKEPLPHDLAPWEELAAPFDTAKGVLHAETEMAVTKALVPCEWDAPDVWARGIIDLLLVDGTTARAYDWKTGKKKADDSQLKLFSVMAMAHYPEVNVVKTNYVWLKTGEMTPATYRREEFHPIWQSFLPRLRRLELAYEQDKWEPRPSGLCNGWCPCTDCEHWRPKK